MAHSGGGEIIARIRSTRNNAKVFELADEPGLAEWLTAQGLTLEDAVWRH